MSSGIALNVERKIELRAELRKPTVSRFTPDMKNPDRDQSLQLGQQSADQTAVDQLNDFFANQVNRDRGASSRTQQYLLFVHTRDATSDDQMPSESAIFKPPDPVNASESKK
jgi:hypothetical protein